MKFRMSFFVISFFFIITSSAIASDNAKLFMVKEGVFDLEIGTSIDLTDRKVLFTFAGGWNYKLKTLKQQHIAVKINGQTESMRNGDRFDFKRYHRTDAIFQDTSKCFIDLVKVIVPKGGRAVATFRFHCV